MSDLVGNPEDRFSHNEAHLLDSVCVKYIFNMFYSSFIAYHMTQSVVDLSGRYLSSTYAPGVAIKLKKHLNLRQKKC